MMNYNGKSGKKYWILKVIFFPIAAAAGIFLFGTIVMKLWNFVMPAVFTGLGVITFWQAIALLILGKILFGGFRGRWGGRCGGCGCGNGKMGGWRGKWMNMSDEEKEKFKEEWKHRCSTDKSAEEA